MTGPLMPSLPETASFYANNSTVAYNDPFCVNSIVYSILHNGPPIVAVVTAKNHDAVKRIWVGVLDGLDKRHIIAFE